jgi:uncharacterized membrane protein YeaQ/YmgE (transglycosylase-associated protein family)
MDSAAAKGILRVAGPGEAMPAAEFHFADAGWSAALPAASAQVVLKWMLKLGPREAWRVVRGLWTNAANDQFGGEPSDYPASRWLRLVFIAELIPITAAIAIIYAFAFVLSPLIFAIYMLTSVRSTTLRGMAGAFTTALHQLDPFLQSILGESWRFVEDGMWAADIRRLAEAPIIAYYNDPEIAEIIVIAHSAGAGVAYDALAEGRPAACAASLHPKPLTLITLGGAMNRYYWLSKQSRTSPDARRLASEPLGHYITGIPCNAPRVLAVTDEARAALRQRFFWLNIFARVDFVPAGPLLPEVREMARIDPCQLKERPVINEDDLLRDHFDYFQNTDLVAPRLIRALYGGEYPWEGDDRWHSPAITRDRVRTRTNGVAKLDAIRVVLVAFIAGWIAAFITSSTWRGFFEHDAGAIISINLGAFGEAITVLAALIGPISLAYFLYSVIRGWWFETE